MPTITANGAELYYEVRGIGPSLLLIHGGGGDAGTVSNLADILAQDFTVVAYDRRGLSRSPRPKEWPQTSIAEQAEDAARLVNALGLAPVAVVGHSLGALIALELLLQHPDLVRRAALLDPGPIDCAIPNRRQKMALPEGVREAMARGPQAGFEALLRNLHVWDNLDAPARQRAPAMRRSSPVTRRRCCRRTGPTTLCWTPTGCPSTSGQERRRLPSSGR